MPSVAYAADIVVTMAGPPQPDACVLVDGERIADIGPTGRLAPAADRVYRLSGVLLPGLVNARSHVEHADAARLAGPGPFVAWLQALDGVTSGWSAQRWSRSAYRGVQQALRAGTTAAGDVVSRGPAVPAAGRAALVGDSWVEVRHVDARHADEVLAGVERALGLPGAGRRVGVAPDSPATVGSAVLQSLSVLAERAGAPLHLQAAATRAETTALATGHGPLAELARRNGNEFEWLDGGTGLSPVRYLEALGMLRGGVSLAHGIWVDAEEADLLARRGVTVVCCPRWNELQRFGEAPLERYAEAGTRLALGTGTPAAVGDADLLAEAGAWWRLAKRRGLTSWPSAHGPRPLAEQALRLATVDGAAAMGWGDRAGLLAPGRRADLVGVALPAASSSVYRDLLEQGGGHQVLTVVAGVRKARRPSADRDWPAIDDTR